MEEESKATELTSTVNITTVNGMMSSIEEEIRAVKSGNMEQGTGRVIATMRRNQFRGIELTLQAARLEKKLMPALIDQFGDLRANAPTVATLPETKSAALPAATEPVKDKQAK